MSVIKVNFNDCKNEFDNRFDEIFLLKGSKLHFAVFGSNSKDGVVDGAKSIWKNIAFLDGLLTIAFNKCPVGHRTLRRSFDQYKCLIHAIKMSVIEDQSNTNIPKVYDNIELYDYPYHFHSASNASKLLLPDYRDCKTKLTRDHNKIIVIFTSQLKALLPENFKTNPKLKGIDLLDHLIDIVDKQKLFFNAINKAIKICIEKEVDDFLVRHNNVIASQRKQKVSKSTKSNKRRRSNSIDCYEDKDDVASNSVSSYENDIEHNSDYNDFDDDFNVVSDDVNESAVSFVEYDDGYNDVNDLEIIQYYCNIHNSNIEYESKEDSDDYKENNDLPDIDDDVIEALVDVYTEDFIKINGCYTSPNSSLINNNSNQTFGELESYDITD